MNANEELSRQREVIGADECAELLHCTPGQVGELACRGEIPGLKFGRSWLFVRQDLLAYLAEKARQEAEKRREGLKPKPPAAGPRPSSRRSRTDPVLPAFP